MASRLSPRRWTCPARHRARPAQVPDTAPCPRRGTADAFTGERPSDPRHHLGRDRCWSLFRLRAFATGMRSIFTAGIQVFSWPWFLPPALVALGLHVLVVQCVVD